MILAAALEIVGVPVLHLLFGDLAQLGAGSIFADGLGDWSA